ncbi:MAG TPA: PAS domain S-box protein [Casimicrobiaceae bacterium]|nr:PAS domain S-box protein [Casimicrobiaceae bacterium]
MTDAPGEDALRRAALALSTAAGPRLYDVLVADLAAILGADAAFVAVLDDDSLARATTLALWIDGARERCVVALPPALCATDPSGAHRTVRGSVTDLGTDTAFASRGLAHYAARPLTGSGGERFGALVAMTRGGFVNDALVDAMLGIFAVRIAGEIERGHAEEALRRAAVAVSSAEGEAVFTELVRVLATILGVEIAFIALPRPDDPQTLRMLAFRMDGAIIRDFEYPRAGTPCDRILRSGFAVFPDRLAEHFPEDAEFKAIGVTSYAGLPLVGPDGGTLGLIAVASRKRLAHPELVESMLKIFAARARTEIERARAEAALRASEAQYRAIFNASADALVLWDSSLRRVDVNPAYERIHGYTREEALRSDYRADLPATFMERRRELVRRTLAGEPCEVEMESLRKDGTRIDVEVRTIPVSHDGRPHVLAIVRDVTERKRIEAAARAGEEQYRAIFNASVDGMALWNAQGRIVDVNPAFLDMHGFDRAEIEDGDCALFLPDDALDPCMRLVRAALAGERAHGEHVTRRKDGTLRNMEIRAAPITYHGERHALWLVRDITERKRADAALQASESQYRAIFNAWADALVLRDADFRIVDVNATYERFTGRRREDVLGIDRVIANPPGVDERVRALHGRVLRGEPIQFETQLLHVDGSCRDLELRGVPIWHQGKAHVLYIGRDVTARKEADAQRMALEAQLRQAQKMEAIGQLTGGIAHDFNNILQSILGYVVLAEERQEALQDPQLGRYLAQVDGAAQRASSLVRQMLTFSRGRNPERRPLVLGALVREAAQMLRSTLPSTILLRTRVDDEDAAVVVDPVQFEQVLLNLGINARDAMRSAGEIAVSTRTVDVHDRACASCRQPVSGRFVEVAVRDSGPGIPDDVAERMFEPFFTTKDVGKGSGMGLAMVHGIVHAHGGHLVVRTAPGDGTRIAVLLPPSEVAGSVPVASGAARPATAKRSLQGSVLVAEDEDAIRELLDEMLTGWGLAVVTAPSATEALAIFVQDPGRFDLVLTDQTMPGMTGVAFAHRVTHVRPGLPVVLCTGFADDIPQDELLAAGIRTVARKPFEPAELHAVVGAGLAMARAAAPDG